MSSKKHRKKSAPSPAKSKSVKKAKPVAMVKNTKKQRAATKPKPAVKSHVSPKSRGVTKTKPARSAKSRAVTKTKPIVKKTVKPKQVAKKLKKTTSRTVKAPASMAMPKSSLTARELRQHRDFLLELREKLTGRISALVQDSLTLSPADGDVDYRSEEEGTESFARDFVLTRASTDQDVVFEIDEALSRIEIGVFGVCEHCLKHIEKPRLQALPYSRLCVHCKGEWEQSQQSRRSFEPTGLFHGMDKNVADAGDEE